MLKKLKNTLKSINSIHESSNEKNLRNKLVELEEKFGLFPPGHYYSPLPDFDFFRNEKESKIKIYSELISIDINKNEQLKLFNEFIGYYKELPFSENKSKYFYYFYENPSFSYSDAIFLYSMIRKTRPKRIIEVGSGYSSCVMADTNRLFFKNSIDLTFIEPYPELLETLMPINKPFSHLISSPIQEVPISIFEKLSNNDILFIDSSHVSKVNSDVNHLFFEVLPRLKKGVYIHFHDIFFPFEYQDSWISEGRAWNENYILRAFLSFNNSFKIVFFNNYLIRFFESMFSEHMPLCLRNGGGSIWLVKTKN